MRIITVKGTGNVSARPDYIILSLNIEVLSETYDRAMSEAAERIERLQGAAVRVGYRKEDLKTTSFDVQTRYENVKDGLQRVHRSQTRHELEAKAQADHRSACHHRQRL